MADASDKYRRISVTSGLGEDVLLFQRMSASEELGRLFRYELDLKCAAANVSDFNGVVNDLLGKAMTVKVDLGEAGTRYFNGVVSELRLTGRTVEMAEDGHPADFLTFHASLRPWTWFLTRTADCRIFQDLTVPDIVKKVFNDRGFSDFEFKTSGTYREWVYCVQYRETDFNFVSRLLEQEGIYYYFQHQDGKHTMVLVDESTGHKPIEGESTLPYITEAGAHVDSPVGVYAWEAECEIQPGTYTLRDYDFEKPNTDLTKRSATSHGYVHSDMEVYDYPGEYLQPSDGEAYTKVRLGELQAGSERFRGQGDALGIAVGGLFTLSEHPLKEQNREYLIVSGHYEMVSDALRTSAGGGGDGEHFTASFSAIQSKQSYRSARITPKPVVQGPQTAEVVGKKGEEIWTDQYGRVKLQFHWDRKGEKDENSSCWVRVAQVWAGKGWGAMHIPRIGQEVVVEFLEGDPDRPLVTGRVYNAVQTVPYGLPDNMTQSGLQSRSTKSGDAKNFNELRFEDKKGSEQVYFHAEKDFERVVENNDSLKVGFDKKDKGDQSVEVFNNHTLNVGAGKTDAADGSQSITVFNNQTLKVGTAQASGASQTVDIYKDRTTTLETGNDKLTVKVGNREITLDQGNHTHKISTGNREVTLDSGNDTLKVTAGNRTVKVSAGKESHEAGQAIELKVGASSIKIEPAKITLKSVQIVIQADAQAEMKAAMTTVNADATLTLKGGVTMIN